MKVGERLEPIKEVILQESSSAESFVRVKCWIDERENLNLEGYSAGAVTEAFAAHPDEEHIVSVRKELVNTCLLLLIQEHFTSEGQFQRWLESKGIPYDVETWP